MSSTYQAIFTINAFFFLFYGLQTLISSQMIEEFKRFGLTAFQRKATGILQLLGAIGLILSYFSLWIGLLSAMGLTSMMLVAFMVRISIKDSVLQSIPAFIFLLVNSWITYAFFDLLW